MQACRARIPVGVISGQLPSAECSWQALFKHSWATAGNNLGLSSNAGKLAWLLPEILQQL